MKPVIEMTDSEVIDELESLERYFQSCADGGHGISSKESIRWRNLLRAVEVRHLRYIQYYTPTY